MSVKNPPPLPKELQDWKQVEIKDFRKPWHHFTPFLASHGFFLFDTPEYDLDPVRHTPPMKPARDPFHPADDEAFVHTIRTVYFKEEYFFQRVATVYLALDQQRRHVYIKAVSRSSSEWKIVEALSTDPLRADVRNHTIPIVSIIPAGEWVFIVQAYWGEHWVVDHFDTVDSRLEMSRQVLEGLAFMHEQGIGHGDIHPGNILWNRDGSRKKEWCCKPGQTPEPFHSTFDFRFALIDFGFSARFPPGATRHLVEPEQMPPEQFAAPEQSRMGEPYDIFASDVYNLGKVLENNLEVATQRKSLPTIALSPAYVELLKQMTRVEPFERISATEALKALRAIIRDPSTHATV